MLSRILSGGEETDCVLFLVDPDSSSSEVLDLFIKSASDASKVLVSTGPNQILPDSDFRKVVRISDFLGWQSGVSQMFPDCILDEVDPGKDVIVIDNLTHILLFHKASAVANLIKKLRLKASSKAKLLMLYYRDCVDDNIEEAVKQLVTTFITVSNLDSTEAFPKLCKIRHRKPGGKLVTSKDVVKLDPMGKTKIEAFKEAVKSKAAEEDDVDEAIDKLTTFNIGTTKHKEKEAKEGLVLPFYKDEQKNVGEVKIQGEPSGKIYYEPDSGDDWDDDDPDDDLDF